MKVSIHYAVKAKLIRSTKDNGEFDFLIINEEFHDESPILAREAAFKYYQNYIDVLLESKGLKYESDNQARKALESFHNPKTFQKVEFMGRVDYFPDSWGNGIGVFVVIDNPILGDPITDSIGEEILIHGIGSIGRVEPQGLMDGLNSEYEYYDYYKYDIKNYKIFVPFYEYDIQESEINEILKTPFDWDGMDKPYDGEPVQYEQPPDKTITIQELIARGETNQIEFKPALHYNFKTQSAAIGIKGIIAKSIAGFLNSKGGFLLIGVQDNGQIQGLSHDFSLSDGKSPRDYFRLQFDDTIKQFLPLFIKDNIIGDFVDIDDKEIFVVKVFPSKTRPIFMNGQHNKEFWVRWTASTRQYTDIEEIATYCLEHWKNMD